MCCSNAECESIEEMFEGDKFDIIEAFIQKKLSRLTEFEEKLVAFAIQCEGEWNTAEEEARKWSRELLALAKKWLAEELNKAFKKGQESSHEDYLRGYSNGYRDAQEEYNKSVAYHFPVMPTPPSGWGCDGTHCTNPHHDCINCPVQYSSGGTITTPNSASGISTATLHGNTSATDGKEHNPSFTD